MPRGSRDEWGQYVNDLPEGCLTSVGRCLLDAAIVKSLGLEKKERQPAVLMTLCPKCSRTFFDSSAYSLLRTDYNQQFKEPCTVCSIGMGFDYYVSRA